MTNPRVLLVDGHSVIFRWPELANQHRERTERARNSLIQLLTAYQDSTGIHVVVVFDGKGSKLDQSTNQPGGIQIFYSQANKTADSVIERIVAKYAARYQVTVATDDHLEQQTTMSLGGEVISTEQLKENMRLAERELTERVNKLRRS